MYNSVLHSAQYFTVPSPAAVQIIRSNSFQRLGNRLGRYSALITLHLPSIDKEAKLSVMWNQWQLCSVILRDCDGMNNGGWCRFSDMG